MTASRVGGRPRRRSFVAAGVIAATAIGLAVAYFPALFNQFEVYDDEGVFNASIRLLGSHDGTLYSSLWADKYGPFYYLFTSSLFKVVGQEPTPDNGRWLVLVLTAGTSMLLAASVWRVTRSLPATVLCEVAAFVVLVRDAAGEPMHPGVLAVFFVAIVVYALAGYAATRANGYLVAMGAAAAAVLMTVLLTGILVIVALATVFVAGNQHLARRVRIDVVAIAALVPAAVIVTRAEEVWAVTFALLVLIGFLGISVSILLDGFTVRKHTLRALAIGAAAVIALSAGYALATGTRVRPLVWGVFVAPWQRGSAVTVPAVVSVSWLAIVLTVVGLYFMLGRPRASATTTRSPSEVQWRLVLAAVGAILLGLAVAAGSNWDIGEWLPVLALLPALAIVGALPEPVRFALRAIAVVAALQVLVAYPVARSQIGWATVVMTVPCAIAIGAGLNSLTLWIHANRSAHVATAAVLCLALVFVSSAWPPDLWQRYLDDPSLDLPGAHLIRVDAEDRQNIRTVADVLRSSCDAFYSVPAMNSFYEFAGFAPLTGLVANDPGVLTMSQQRRVAKRLHETSLTKRVCVLRNLDRSDDVALAYGTGPLHDELSRFTRVVRTIGDFSVSRKNRQALQIRNVDPFLCSAATSARRASGAAFMPPARTLIAHQLDPQGSRARIDAVDTQCDQAKLGPQATSGRLDDSAAHLVCWSASVPTRRATVRATNRFGTAVLRIRAARHICVASSSGAIDAPRRSPPSESTPYSCSRVDYTKRGGRFSTVKPTSVLLRDPSMKEATPAQLASARLLCLPARIGRRAQPEPTVQSVPYVCFVVGLLRVFEPPPRSVYDRNVFGSARVTVGKPQFLCLPSALKALKGR